MDSLRSIMSDSWGEEGQDKLPIISTMAQIEMVCLAPIQLWPECRGPLQDGEGGRRDHLGHDAGTHCPRPPMRKENKVFDFGRSNPTSYWLKIEN